MNAIIKLLIPRHGFGFCEVEYHTNPVGSKTLYTIDSAWQSYRGERREPISVSALLSFNPYEEIEARIVEEKQGSHRRGLEKDAANPRIQKHFASKFKPKKKGIPE